MKSFSIKLIRSVLSYIIASLGAGTVFALLWGSFSDSSFFDEGAMTFFGVVFLFSTLIAAFALPVAVMMIAIAWRRRIAHVSYFLCAAILSFAVPAALMIARQNDLEGGSAFLVAGILAALTGGFLFWAITGRHYKNNFESRKNNFKAQPLNHHISKYRR